MDVDMAEPGMYTDKWYLLNLTQGLIYVSGLNTAHTQTHLWDMMVKCGNVQWVYLTQSMQYTSLGYGYVKFENDEPVQRILANPQMLDNDNLGTTPFVMRSMIDACTRFVDAGKLYVYGFGPDVTEDELKLMFQQYGNFYELRLIQPGVACVHYAMEYSATVAIQSLHGVLVGGSPMSLCLWDRQPNLGILSTRRVTLRFYNLDMRTTNNDLRDLFKHIGPVTARVEKGSDGVSRGTGFVFFERPTQDTPLFNTFTAYAGYSSNDTILAINDHLRTVSYKRRPVYLPNYPKFAPDAIPPHFGKMYRIPVEYRKYSALIDDYYNGPPGKSEDIKDTFLGMFHVHVSNLGSQTAADLRSFFKQFGEVVFCVTRYDDQIDPFAIVTFRQRYQALAAIEMTRKLRKGRTGTIIAELLDSYQYFLQNDIKDEFGYPAYPQHINGYINNVDDETGKVTRLPMRQTMKVVETRLHYMALCYAVTGRKPEQYGKDLSPEELALFRQRRQFFIDTFDRHLEKIRVIRPAPSVPQPIGIPIHKPSTVPTPIYLRDDQCPSQYKPAPPQPPPVAYVAPLNSVAPNTQNGPIVGNEATQAVEQEEGIFYEKPTSDTTADKPVEIRSRLAAMIARLFPKYSEAKRAEALNDVLLSDSHLILYAMRDDQEFRKFVVQLGVAKARNNTQNK